jgi:hypothetical protein
VLSKACDVKLANHGAIVYFYGSYAIMHNQTTFGKASIGGGYFEGFREPVGPDLMDPDEIFGHKGSCCSGVYNGGGFDSFQTIFGNKSHWNMQFLSFSNSLYKSYCYIGRY